MHHRQNIDKHHLTYDATFLFRVRKTNVKPSAWVGVQLNHVGLAVCTRCELVVEGRSVKVTKQLYMVGDRPTGKELWTYDQPRCPVCDPEIVPGFCAGAPIQVLM